MTQDDFNVLPVDQKIIVLKAQNFDLIGVIENAQRNIQANNAALQELVKQPILENQSVEPIPAEAQNGTDTIISE